MTEPPAHSFGEYQLTEKIAQGGMAEIFKGRALDAHEGIERPIVIKRILPHISASPEFVEMLIDEAKIAVMLSHGNIAQIYDLGKVADDYFIVMEYVDGKTLSQIMKRLKANNRFIPIAYAAYLCTEVTNGLDYMHRKTDDQGNPLHIIHRDISPQNIILSTAGTVKIIDFGIAKAKTKVSTTDSGILKGKFAYMSPEHANGEKLDDRTDIFSLGVILFELLAGQRLFKGKNNQETIRRIRKARVPTPSGIRSAIPKALDQIVLKALQKDKTKRYQTAHAFSQDLTKFLISHYPDFSPRDLIPFLQELFPEIIPVEKPPKEEKEDTQGPLLENPKDRDPEDTVEADSGIIRTKLKESEVFHVEAEPKSEESSPSPVVFVKRPIRIPWQKIGIGLGALLLVGMFLGGIKKASQYPLHKKIAEIRHKLIAKKSPPPEPILTKAPPVLPVTVQPEPPPNVGSLRIHSEPEGAKIFLNDVETNRKTPAVISQIPANKEQKVGLHLDRYRFWEGTVRVENGKTTNLSIPLQLNYGDLEINSIPSGATVALNGKEVGKTPYSQGQIPPETAFDVVIRAEKYEDWKGLVKIFGGKKEMIHASLKKSSAEQN